MGQILSGGQKSRISLARALYRKNANIVLIDGTLSSLDVRVSQHVFKKAILELCEEKLVIFVTYDPMQAAQMDYVLHLDVEGEPYRLYEGEEFKDMMTSSPIFKNVKKEDGGKDDEETGHVEII